MVCVCMYFYILLTYMYTKFYLLNEAHNVACKM